MLQGLSQTADAVTALTVTRFLMVELRSTAPRDLLVALLVSMGPAVLCLPVAWAVADSGCRMRLLATTQLLRAGVSAGAVVALLTSSPALGYTVIGLMTALQTIAASMRSAVLPRAVPTTRLIAANSLCAITGRMAGLLGIALVVGLRVVDQRIVLVVAAVLHSLSAYGYLSWRLELGGHRAASSMRDLAREVRSLRHMPGAGGVVPTALALRTMQGAVALAAATSVPQRSSSTTVNATMLGIVAVGTFTGTVLAPNLAAMAQRRNIPSGTTTWAAALLLSAGAFMPQLPARLSLLLMLSVGFGIARLHADTVVQSVVSDHALGRTLATYDASYQVAFVAGAALVGVAHMAAPEGFPTAGPIVLVAIIVLAPLLSARRRSLA
jgi:hypothetical protein